MKKRQPSRKSAKLAAAGRGKRMVMVVALLALVPALGVFVWPKPAAVGRYLGLSAQAEAVSLTLRAEGFDPVRVSRDGGAFTLSISNQSGQGAVTLHLYRSNGERVREINLGAGAAGWSESVSLAPGSYTLVAPDNPAWLCKLKIQ
jgi:hypothetical protein